MLHGGSHQLSVKSSEQILMWNTQELNTRLLSSIDAVFPCSAGVAIDEQVSQLAALKQYTIDLTDPSIVDLTANPAVFPEMSIKKASACK